jgi:hypothetical protein
MSTECPGKDLGRGQAAGRFIILESWQDTRTNLKNKPEFGGSAYAEFFFWDSSR